MFNLKINLKRNTLRKGSKQKENLVEGQVKKVLADGDQKIILMARS